MRTSIYWASLVLLIGSSLSLAQEVDDGIVQGPIQGPPGTIVPRNGLSLGFTMPAVDSQSEQSDGLQFLHNPSVVKDLELTKSQIKQLRQVRIRFGKKLNKLAPEIMDAQRDPDKLEAITKVFSALEREKIDELKKVLLDHQLVRLEQVAVQKAIELKGGPSQAFQSGLLSTKLKITASQKKRLHEIHRQLLVDLAAQKLKLENQARARALATLTPKQRTEFKTLIGNKFKEPKQDQIEFLNSIRDRQKEVKQESGEK